MRYPNEEIEAYRRNAGELENELIDEYRAGTLSRKELIQRGSVLGMSLPFLGLLAGPAQAAISRPMARPMDVGQRGGTIRIGTASIDASLEPPLLQTLAAISVTQISGEQLTFADKNAVLRPRLATAWKPSRGGRTWTFQIRRGVRFQDGKPMTVADVVATFRRLLGPDSQALSSYKGVIRSVRAVGRNAVRFDLEAPNGLFPYLTAQMTYQSIILPASYKLPTDLQKPGEFTSKMNGTGPFRLLENRGPGGITWEANPTYWGGRPAIDRVEMQVLDDQARVTALQSGQIDLAVQVSYECAAAAAGEQEGPADSHCEPPLPEHERHQGAVQRRPGTPGDRAGVGPPGHRTRPLGPVRGGRQRQPDVGRISVHGEERPTAQAQYRAGAGAAPSRREGEPQAHAHVLPSLRDARLRASGLRRR